MILDSILSPKKIEKHPIEMFVLGFIVTSIAVVIAYAIPTLLPAYILSEHISAWFLFLTAIALVPILNKLFAIEESKENKLLGKNLLDRHDEVIFAYFFLFLGMVVSFSFWFTMLPPKIAMLLFQDQWNEIIRIQGLRSSILGSIIHALAPLTGHTLTTISGAITNKKMFLIVILINNLRLLFLFMAFSFVFGAGAILLLTWNAAVVGVAIGNLIREGIVATASIFAKTTFYFRAFPLNFMSFFVHGIFEIIAYFLGAIAGGILSVSIVRKHYLNENFKRVALDVAIIFAWAVLLIIFGAFIEVYITPIL